MQMQGVASSLFLRLFPDKILFVVSNLYGWRKSNIKHQTQNSEVERMSEADEEHVAQTKVKDKSRLPTLFLLLLFFFSA